MEVITIYITQIHTKIKQLKSAAFFMQEIHIILASDNIRAAWHLCIAAVYMELFPVQNSLTT